MDPVTALSGLGALIHLIASTIEDIEACPKHFARLARRLDSLLEKLRQADEENSDNPAAVERIREVVVEIRRGACGYRDMNKLAQALRCRTLILKSQELNETLTELLTDLTFLHLMEPPRQEEENNHLRGVLQDIHSALEGRELALSGATYAQPEAMREQDEVRQGLKALRMGVPPGLRFGVEEVDFADLQADSRSPLLGRGGFGRVVVGKLDGAPVAVKILSDIEENASAKQAMRREIKVHSSLSHPCVVQLLAACTVAPQFALVLELAPHGSLFKLLHQRSPPDAPLLPLHTRLCMARDVVSGMSYLHRNSVVHGDLKSLNLLVFDQHRVKICDFGMSAVVGSLTTRGRQSQNNTGTTAWKAPEVYTIGSNPASDVFSFGMVLYELLSGLRPFDTVTDDFQIMLLVREGKRPKLPEAVPAPSAAVELMESCLHQDPLLRPAFNATLYEAVDAMCQAATSSHIPAGLSAVSSVPPQPAGQADDNGGSGSTSTSGTDSRLQAPVKPKQPLFKSGAAASSKASSSLSTISGGSAFLASGTDEGGPGSGVLPTGLAQQPPAAVAEVFTALRPEVPSTSSGISSVATTAEPLAAGNSTASIASSSSSALSDQTMGLDILRLATADSYNGSEGARRPRSSMEVTEAKAVVFITAVADQPTRSHAGAVQAIFGGKRRSSSLLRQSLSSILGSSKAKTRAGSSDSGSSAGGGSAPFGSAASGSLSSSGVGEGCHAETPSGAGEAVVLLMLAFPTSAQVQLAGCAAISALVERLPQSAATAVVCQMREAGAAAAVVSALRFGLAAAKDSAPPTNSTATILAGTAEGRQALRQLPEKASSVALLLACRGRDDQRALVAAGACEAAASALQWCVSLPEPTPALLQPACRLAASLAECARQSNALLVEAGACEAVVAVLRCRAALPISLWGDACEMMTNLAFFSDTGSRERLLAAGAREEIEATMAGCRSDRSVIDCCHQALSLLLPPPLLQPLAACELEPARSMDRGGDSS